MAGAGITVPAYNLLGRSAVSLWWKLIRILAGGLHLYQEKYFFPEVEITQGHHPKTWSQFAPCLGTWVSESSVLMVTFPAKTQLSVRESSQCESQVLSIILILYAIPDEYFAVQQCLPPLSTPGHRQEGALHTCPQKSVAINSFHRVPVLSVLVKGCLK